MSESVAMSSAKAKQLSHVAVVVCCGAASSGTPNHDGDNHCPTPVTMDR